MSTADHHSPQSRAVLRMDVFDIAATLLWGSIIAGIVGLAIIAFVNGGVTLGANLIGLTVTTFVLAIVHVGSTAIGTASD